MRDLTPPERRGLRAAGVVLLMITALLLWEPCPTDGFLRDPATGSLLRSPFKSGILALIFIIGAASGIAYGIAAGTCRNHSDVIATMLPYTVALLIVWTLLLIGWMLLGLPVGPGAPLYLPTAAR